jgi:hypothetical protein
MPDPLYTSHPMALHLAFTFDSLVYIFRVHGAPVVGDVENEIQETAVSHRERDIG